MIVLETASDTIKAAAELIKSLKPLSERERDGDDKRKKINEKQI
jgi:hypothetical protein